MTWHPLQPGQGPACPVDGTAMQVVGSRDVFRCQACGRQFTALTIGAPPLTSVDPQRSGANAPYPGDPGYAP